MCRKVLQVSIGLAMVGLILVRSVEGAVTQLDDEDAGQSFSGAWLRESGSNLNGGDEWYQSSPNNGGTATWSFSGLAAGNYCVAASWRSGANRTTAARYELSDGIPAVMVDQSLVSSFGFDDAAAVGYARLSGFSGYVPRAISDGTLDVTVSHSVASRYLMADSVRLETVAADVEKIYIIDSEEGTGYAEQGSWGQWAEAGDHRSSFRYGTANGASARYTLTGLDGGVYRVYANWTASVNRPSDATYMIDGFPNIVKNQQVAPNDGVLEAVNWELLYPCVPIYGGTLTLTVTNPAAGTQYALIADAVMLQKVAPPVYVKVEDFQSHAAGSDIDSAGGWVEFPSDGAAGGSVILDPLVPGQKEAQLTGAASNEGYVLPLGANTVVDGSKATLFFRYRSAGSMSVYLTESDSLGPPSWWDVDQAGIYNNYNVGDGSAVRTHWDAGAVADIDLDTWYNVWVVVDSERNVYDLYLSRHFDHAVGGDTSVAVDFNAAYSGGTAVDFDHLFIVSNNDTMGGAVDDIYMAQGASLLLPDALQPSQGTVFIIR